MKNNQIFCNLTKSNGAITVWMSYITLIIMAFILCLLEIVNINTAKIVENRIFISSLYSIGADYDPNIRKNYHFLMITQQKNSHELKQSATEYIKLAGGNYLEQGEFCLPKIKLKDIKLTRRCSVENNLTVFNKQVIRVLENLYGEESEKLFVSKYKVDEGMEKNKLIMYLLEHFSNAKNQNVLSQFYKKNLYEIEYLVAGNLMDNANIFEILNDRNLEEITQVEYEKILIQKMLNLQREILLKRMLILIENNISLNSAYQIDMEACWLECELEVSFEKDSFIENKFIGKIFQINQRKENDNSFREVLKYY